MRRKHLSLGLAALAIYLVLAQPNHPDAMSWWALTIVPLEWPALLLALLALGTGRGSLLFRAIVVGLLILIAALKTIDYAMFTFLSRGFNPVADFFLVDAAMRWMTGAVGPVATAMAGAGVVFLLATLTAVLWWATCRWAKAGPVQPRLRGFTAVAALFSAGVAAAEVGDRMRRWELPVTLPGTAFTARVGVERLQMVRSTLSDLSDFRAAAASDPYSDTSGLLDMIDRDVIVVFVESYGRASLDTPNYADLHRKTLAAQEAALASRGLAMASGLLASPTRGGQSWLAHATFANGLWVDDQTRYGAVLASQRQTLFHVAAAAGFHTAAVMPQITLEWPESAVMGFETILTAADFGYAGPNFNWVTMPDQFVFAAVDRLLRDIRRDDRPLFIQVATASSHAPWMPVPELVDWLAIGDGRVFDAMAASGDSPGDVWRDRDRVRSQYRLAVDYALRTAFAYAERHAADPPLMIILGDHQAADFVALDERPHVPMHLVGPSHLINRAAADWHLTPGLIPEDSSAVPPMDQMRDRILQSFSSAVPRNDSRDSKQVSRVMAR